MDGNEPLTYNPARQTEFEHGKNEQVVRKVNSGFQILAPGTFAPPPASEMELPQNRVDERRKSGKLHKKSRSVSARNSQFQEGV